MSKAVKHSQDRWHMQNELIPGQSVREVLLNIKVSRAKLFLVRKNDMRGVGNTGGKKIRLEWSETISMSQTNALTKPSMHLHYSYHTQTHYRKDGRERRWKKRKKRRQSSPSVCSSSAIRTLSLSVVWLSKLTIFSKCYPQRREVVIYRPEETALWTNKQVFTPARRQWVRWLGKSLEELVFWDRTEGRRTGLQEKEATVILWQASHPLLSCCINASCEHLPPTSNNKWARAAFVHPRQHLTCRGSTEWLNNFMSAPTMLERPDCVRQTALWLQVLHTRESKARMMKCECKRDRQSERVEGVEAKKTCCYSL